MEHLTLLLLVSLFFPCGAQGPPECEEQAVSANGMLELLPKKPLREWARVRWKMGLDAGSYQLILVAERNKPASVPKSSFSGRAVFQEEPLSLRISPVHAADTGIYEAEFEDPGGGVSTRCFRVSVWGHSSIIPGWAVAVAVAAAVLALAIAIALVITFYWRRKRRKDPSGGHIEQTLTIYEEVGKAQTGQDPSAPRNEATSGDNTVYAVICKAQGPRLPREPESRTIYTSLQPTRKPPSARKKKLDPALISTAYAEATGFSRRPPSQLLPLALTGHHLS